MIPGVVRSALFSSALLPCMIVAGGTTASAPSRAVNDPIAELCQNKVPADSPPDPLGVNPVDYGWKEVLALVAIRGNTYPKWEDWATKSDLKMDGAQTPPSLGDALSIQPPAVQPQADHTSKLLHNLRLPVQQQPRDDLFVAPGPKAPVRELASVFYNCEAATTIQRFITRQHARGQVPPLLPSAAVVKEIWATLDESQQFKFWASTLTPASERDWKSRPLADKQHQGQGLGYPYSPQADRKLWRTACVGLPGPCAPLSSDQKTTVVVSNQSIYQLPTLVSRVVLPSTLLFTPACSDFCKVVLVGVNLMVKPPTGPTVWIALWWTGTPNGYRVDGAELPEPWKYYQMAVTTQARNADGVNGNIVFNPYLEGIGPPPANGAVSNCVNCHTYAAFQIDATHHTRARMNRGLSLGQPDLGPASVQQETLSASHTAQSLYASDTGVVLTDSLWSLASAASLPSQAGTAKRAPPTSAPKAKRRKTKNH